MDRYREISREVFCIFRRFSPLVEPLSIDEAFLDVSGCTRLFGPPEIIAATIKEAVSTETGLTVSAGVAPNKFVAKIASDIEKPDGLVKVEPEDVADFLAPLPVECMWGVGKTTLSSLRRMGVRTIGDLRSVPPWRMERTFGANGERMGRLAWGDDFRAVETERETKSLGREETYARDVTDRETARREILALATRVARRLRRYGLSGRTVTLKVKYADFKQITRSKTLAESTDDAQVIREVCNELADRTAIGKRGVRLLGISLAQLAFSGEARQISLFNTEVVRQRRRDLNRALDAVADRFGEHALRPAALIKSPEIGASDEA
jgi:DNA polymerase-4